MWRNRPIEHNWKQLKSIELDLELSFVFRLTSLWVVAIVEQRALICLDLSRRHDDADIETENDDRYDEEDGSLGDVGPGLPDRRYHFFTHAAVLELRLVLPEVALDGVQYHGPGAQADDDNDRAAGRAELFASERVTYGYVAEHRRREDHV